MLSIQIQYSIVFTFMYIRIYVHAYRYKLIPNNKNISIFYFTKKTLSRVIFLQGEN